MSLRRAVASYTRVAGTRAFASRSLLLAPKKKHIVPEFKEDSLDWQEVDKKHTAEERYARQRDAARLEALLNEVKQVVNRHSDNEKHFWVSVGDKDPVLVSADDWSTFQSELKKIAPNAKSVKTTIKVEGDEFKADFDEKLFKKYNDKRVYVQE